MLDTLGIIQSYNNEKDCRFVFPSDMAARNAAETLSRQTKNPVALNRFIAWDRFKELTLSGDSVSRIPANSLIRRLFTNALFEENAQKAKDNTALFKDIIPPVWAHNYSSFIEGTASILSLLGPLKTEIEQQSGSIPYFDDLRLLLARWEAFMNEKDLFEPGWNRQDFAHHDTHWVLLYPDLVEDWLEYSNELERNTQVHIHLLQDIPTLPAPEAPRLVPCKTLSEELSTVARLIRFKLDSEHIPASEIVVSVPELDSLRSRIVDCFKYYDIPLSIHAGLPLANWPFGRLLQRIKDCANSKWSFDSLKILLLDPSIPWKNRDTIQRFLEFGRIYRCVSGYEENGMLQDVWETSFERILRSASKRERYHSAQVFWRQFKKDCMAILGASDFAKLRENLLKFKTNLFDEGQAEQIDNQVVSRILEELNDLAHTANRLALHTIPSPFSLFLNHLRAATYVPQDTKDTSIHVYPYRVSAGISTSVHVVINANQNSLSISPRGNQLLPEPLRKLVHSDKRRLGELFIQAYRHSGKQLVFTMAVQGPNGYSIPHTAIGAKDSGFATETCPPDLAPDPWTEESNALSKKTSFQSLQATQHDSHAEVHRASIQDRAWKHWLTIKRAPNTRPDFRHIGIYPEHLWPSIFQNMTHEKDDPRLAPTDLSIAGTCPFAWLLSKGLALDELASSIETVEQREVGTLYHKILESVFLRMKEYSTRIRNSDLNTWLLCAEEECITALSMLREEEGSFQDSVYDMLHNRISASIKVFIQSLLPEVEEATILGIEMPLAHSMPEYPVRLSGKADLVLLLPDDTLLLADFKTNYAPTSSELILVEGAERIDNYQLAAYMLMLEKEGKQTSVAWFYSLDKRAFTRVVAPERPKGTRGILPLPREEYQKEIDSLQPFFTWICSMFATKTFPVLPHSERARCRNCSVRSICRIPYIGEE